MLTGCFWLLPAASKSTRTFSDFESVADAMNGICQLYEQRLKQMNPGKFFCPTPPIWPFSGPSRKRPAALWPDKTCFCRRAEYHVRHHGTLQLHRPAWRFVLLGSQRLWSIRAAQQAVGQGPCVRSFETHGSMNLSWLLCVSSSHPGALRQRWRMTTRQRQNEGKTRVQKNWKTRLG